MINWKVRLKNKAFWVTVIPAIFLLIQTVASALGIHLDLTETQNDILQIVNALFALLTVTGVVVDPTTIGVGDSERALEYDTPAK